MGRTVFDKDAPLNEGATAQIGCDLVNASGSAVDGAAVLALHMTLRSGETGEIVNGRGAVDVLGTGGGSMPSETGAWTLTLSPDDMAVLAAEEGLGKRHLLRVVTLVGTYASGDSEPPTFTHEIQFYLRALEAVPMEGA